MYTIYHIEVSMKKFSVQNLRQLSEIERSALLAPKPKEKDQNRILYRKLYQM